MKQTIKFLEHSATVIIKNPVERIQSHWAKGAFYEVGRNKLLSAIWAHRELMKLEGAEIIDVGANVGNHSIFFATVFGARVQAFEPSEKQFLHFRENVIVAGLEDKINPVFKAVGATFANCEIIPALASVDSGGEGMGRVAIDDTGAVAVVPLDADPIATPRLIKIDVEGFEMEVLRGAERIIAENRPFIAVEVSPENQKAFYSWVDLNKYKFLVPFILNYGSTCIIQPR